MNVDWCLYRAVWHSGIPGPWSSQSIDVRRCYGLRSSCWHVGQRCHHVHTVCVHCAACY